MSGDPIAGLTGGLFQSTQWFSQLDHPRAMIRHHVRDRLIAQTAAEGRVFASKFLPIDVDRLASVGPMLLVYTQDERVADQMVADSPPIYRVLLELRVEILAVSSLPDLQDAFDAIAQGVVPIVLRDETQNGIAERTQYDGAAWEFTNEGKFRVAAMVLTFTVAYQVSAEDLVGVGDELERVHADWDLGPSPDGEIEAQTQVDDLQD